MTEFANDVHSGEASALISYYTRVDAPGIDFDAPLQVPATWRHLFVREPQLWHVVGAEPWADRETLWTSCILSSRAVLLGDDDNTAFPGMVLHSAWPEIDATATCLLVEPPLVFVEIEIWVNDTDDPITAIEPGHIFSTRSALAGSELDVDLAMWHLNGIRSGVTDSDTSAD